MVCNAYTIIEPLAVVIEAFDTFIANIAMPWVLWLQNLTLWTNIAWIKILVQVQERYLLRLLDISRIFEDTGQESNKCEEIEDTHKPSEPMRSLTWKHKDLKQHKGHSKYDHEGYHSFIRSINFHHWLSQLHTCIVIARLITKDLFYFFLQCYIFDLVKILNWLHIPIILKIFVSTFEYQFLNRFRAP